MSAKSKQRQVTSEEYDVSITGTDNELNTATLKLLTINFGTYSDDRKAKVSKRREEVKTVINITPKYDLIFAQEIPAPKSEAKRLGIKDLGYKDLIITKESGLMWSHERLTLINTVVNDPKVKQDARDEVMTDNRGSELNSRSTAAVFEVSIPGPKYNLLAISWHGPHTKCKNFDDKKETFKLLQKYANKLKLLVESRSDNTIIIKEIIIGGDFNLDLKLLDDALENGFKIVCCDNKKPIDGYVYQSQYHMFEGPEEVEGCPGLDHKPVKVQLDVIVTEPEE